MLRLAEVVLVSLVVGCAATSEFDACPGGNAPSLESCEAGLFDADCGGTGDPVLACAGDCKWFVGGCPAEGYRPIDCPLGDPFCVETADGQWPYESGVVDDPFPDSMCDQVDLLGDAMVTASSGPLLELRIDPTLTVPEVPTIECEGVDLGICAWDWIMRGRAISPGSIDRITLAFRNPSEYGEVIEIELLDDVGGSPAARAWLTQFTDVWVRGEDCSQHVSRFGTTTAPRPIVASGELVLTAEPAEGIELHGEATIVTTEGGTMTLRF